MASSIEQHVKWVSLQKQGRHKTGLVLHISDSQLVAATFSDLRRDWSACETQAILKAADAL